MRRPASKLGASEPRQEGPADLRLVPPAMAAWAGAALALGAPGRWTTVGVILCVGAAMVLLAMSGASATRVLRRGAAGASPGRPSSDADADADAGAGASASASASGNGNGDGDADADTADRAAAEGRWWSRATATATAAALLCAAAGAAAGGLHSADVRQGPVRELAERFSTVEAEVTVTSDARLTTPRVRGDHSTPVALLMDAEITRLTGPDGAVTGLSTPVLLIVSPGGSTGPWQQLLPSTHLRVGGRIVTATARRGAQCRRSAPRGQGAASHHRASLPPPAHGRRAARRAAAGDRAARSRCEGPAAGPGGRRHLTDHP